MSAAEGFGLPSRQLTADTCRAEFESVSDLCDGLPLLLSTDAVDAYNPDHRELDLVVL
jgi:hypothetical protein